eukprot:COSAG03_NODE_957_length_5178_cov_6.712603_1_plen_43_part_00
MCVCVCVCVCVCDKGRERETKEGRVRTAIRFGELRASSKPFP